MNKLTIAVDLDGTLAFYDHWRGVDHIGDPIPLMLERVRIWIEKGHTVKIFTARAEEPQCIPFIEKWLVEYGIGGLEVTNRKTGDIDVIYDDRAIRIEANTGLII